MRFLKNKIAKAMQSLQQDLPDPANIPQAPKSTHSNESPGSKDLAESVKSASEFEVKEENQNSNPSEMIDLPPGQPKRRKRSQGDHGGAEKVRATKNVVKNYGKAICSFSTSDIARPYLLPLIHKENVQVEDFIQYVTNHKEAIDSIKTLRAILLIEEDDSDEIKAYKRIFAGIGEAFIKYFSVNWIFSGRVTHKDAHLKFRYKMLRRIRDPESFTYIQKSRRGSKYL